MGRVKLVIEQKGAVAIGKKLLSMSKYFRERMIEDNERLAEQGVEILRQAILASGIRARPDGMLAAVHPLEITPTLVVIGFAGSRTPPEGGVSVSYDQIADTLDRGGVIPPSPPKMGKGAGVYVLLKPEGVRFRKSVKSARVIRKRDFLKMAADDIETAGIKNITVSIQRHSP